MILINNRNRSNKTIGKWRKIKAIEGWLKMVGGQNFGLKNRARGGFAHEGGAHEGGMTVLVIMYNVYISYHV